MYIYGPHYAAYHDYRGWVPMHFAARYPKNFELHLFIVRVVFKNHVELINYLVTCQI